MRGAGGEARKREGSATTEPSRDEGAPGRCGPIARSTRTGWYNGTMRDQYSG